MPKNKKPTLKPSMAMRRIKTNKFNKEYSLKFETIAKEALPIHFKNEILRRNTEVDYAI